MNDYIALYKQDGSRVSEGTEANPIKPSDVLLIPNSGEFDSGVIPFTIKTTAGYQTHGNTTLKLINGNNTNNRWKLATDQSFTGQTWGQDLVITSIITSSGLQLYAMARALGPVAGSFTTTNDTIDSDPSVDIQVSGVIIKA